MNLRGRRVLITGASSGIGAALARSLAHRGAALVLASRGTAALRSLAAEIARNEPRSPDPIPLVCDVTDPGAVARLVDAIDRRFGTLDVLVNNAGISMYGRGDFSSDADVRALFEVNFFGPLRLIRAALPLLRRSDSGLIVNIASVAALYGVPYLGPYGASKAALAAFSQSLRAENAAAGIRVLVVYPDYTDTPLFRNETNAGGAHRPAGRCAPASRVAGQVAEAMEKDRSEVVLGARGRLLSVLRATGRAPLDRVMAGVAARLADAEG